MLRSVVVYLYIIGVYIVLVTVVVFLSFVLGAAQSGVEEREWIAHTSSR